MVNDSAIKYQNILLDNLDEPINITFSTPSPLNALVARRNTTFTANESYIKKYCQTAFDHLKRQILTEVTQEIKIKCNISKCNTSSTPDIIHSLKFYIQTLERKINFLRSELREKTALVMSLVTSYMLYGNVHVPYENVHTNPHISSSKIIGPAKFFSSSQVSKKNLKRIVYVL